uniref:Uncharacterized protein n=1 Tax=Arundo donax TaxID=35708 RepID=A0A0A9GAI2_ARUDO
MMDALLNPLQNHGLNPYEEFNWWVVGLGWVQLGWGMSTFALGWVGFESPTSSLQLYIDN